MSVVISSSRTKYIFIWWIHETPWVFCADINELHTLRCAQVPEVWVEPWSTDTSSLLANPVLLCAQVSGSTFATTEMQLAHWNKGRKINIYTCPVYQSCHICEDIFKLMKRRLDVGWGIRAPFPTAGVMSVESEVFHNIPRYQSESTVAW